MASKRKKKMEMKASRAVDDKMVARRDAFNEALWKYGPPILVSLILVAAIFFIFIYEPGNPSAESWNLEEADTGVMYNSDDYYSEGVTLVEFFNTRCGHCQVQTDALNEVYAKYKDTSGFNMFAIGGYKLGSNQDSKGDIASFKFEYGLEFPHLYDPSAGLMRDYGFQSYPSMVLIKDGEIVYSHSGKLSAEALSAEIDKHLS